MQPGRLDQRVSFRRRASVDGMRTGDLEGFFGCWAQWRPLSAREVDEAGSRTDAIAGTLTIPDTPRARDLAMDDRAVFRGSDLVVTSAGIPDGTGYLQLQLVRQVGPT